MEIKRRFGNRIRELRLQKSLSQEKLAFLSGLHRTYISDVEIGKRNISLENISRLACALGISLTELFSFNDPA
ncbi:MAG TPA: XRE family transcriptional regulator [Desulfobacteraceae bacterium]|nr:XRE family transcriptional regulator [Desulfobacteraceae bacterium]